MNIQLGSENIAFDIEYGKRKNVVLHIDYSGRVTVKAPKGTQEDVIRKGLIANGEMILEKIRSIKQQNLRGPSDRMPEPGTFLYLGKTHPYEVLFDPSIAKDQFQFRNGTLFITAKSEEQFLPDDILKKFYFRECRRIILSRITVYEKEFKVKPSSVVIEESRNKWGSCDSNRRLTFNWQLAMAPLEIIDYIVVHEMCHLVHLNHDRSFWRLVGKILPDYHKLEWHGPQMSVAPRFSKSHSD